MSKDTNIAEILQSVEDRIVLKLGGVGGVLQDASQIRWAVDELPTLQGDWDIVLRPRREQNVEGRRQVGGAFTMHVAEAPKPFVQLPTPP